MFCNECPKYDKCKTVCPELERFLERKPTDRLYSDRWIRAKEIPVNPAIFNNIKTPTVMRGTEKDKNKWFIKDTGKQKNTKNFDKYDEN